MANISSVELLNERRIRTDQLRSFMVFPYSGRRGHANSIMTLGSALIPGGGAIEPVFTIWGGEDLEAAENHALASWREYMPIVTSLEQPD